MSESLLAFANLPAFRGRVAEVKVKLDDSGNTLTFLVSLLGALRVHNRQIAAIIERHFGDNSLSYAAFARKAQLVLVCAHLMRLTWMSNQHPLVAEKIEQLCLQAKAWREQGIKHHRLVFSREGNVVYLHIDS